MEQLSFRGAERQGTGLHMHKNEQDQSSRLVQYTGRFIQLTDKMGLSGSSRLRRFGMTIGIYKHSMSSFKNVQFGLVLSIKTSFFSRRQFLICFSRFIALNTYLNFS